MISTATAEHYTWGESCDGWHLVKSSALSVIQECTPAGTHEVEHSHRRARQFFFVLGGSLKIEVSGGLESLTTRQGLEITPGLRHALIRGIPNSSCHLSRRGGSHRTVPAITDCRKHSLHNRNVRALP